MGVPLVFMFVTFSFFAVAYSFSTLFLNIFVWKQQASLVLLGFFQLCSFLFTFIGFALGAYVIHKTGSRLNLIISSLTALTLYLYLLLGSFDHPPSIAVAGVLNGLYIGLFFAGLNFYSLWFAEQDRLTWVMSLQYVLSGLAQLFTPPVAGWLILHLGYDAAFMAALSVLGCQTLSSVLTPQVRISQAYRRKGFFIPATRRMGFVGLSAASFGFFFSFVHMSLSIFIYCFLHNEWHVGEWNMLFACLSVLTYFVLGCQLLQSCQHLLASLGVLASTIMTFTLFIPSPLVFIIFNAVISISLPMLWVPALTKQFETIRLHVRLSTANPLTKMMELLVFREFWLCVGRMLFFILFMLAFSVLTHQGLAVLLIVLCFMPAAIYVLSLKG
ncbi:hypothetical protein CathTA2_0954 [Caldalkalibacillus thermarum TA2.A1]|uniref:Major facilitator superfamily MFS_1 n=1 Tax=Caldalkalibacillus thermarum (strain TA2.A1) TaxID=986075 RepID=F5L591_CALTT|nr:hypothetical protein [Caldalkalibacillus thermarum]EGL83489.1 hypothetical protein CathTA2_0954 [Caldalkalibacillus thermarum TA2.A1]QZT34386.1 hypothetical protein HUR95_03020 [Caldalkalibacillus thermarum TA2.A1]